MYSGLVPVNDVAAPARAPRRVRKQVSAAWAAAHAAGAPRPGDMWRPEEQKARSVSLAPQRPPLELTPLSVATAALQCL